nr:MAG TPA: hypothetical protein [Caudoviricetes sp.]
MIYLRVRLFFYIFVSYKFHKSLVRRQLKVFSLEFIICIIKFI